MKNPPIFANKHTRWWFEQKYLYQHLERWSNLPVGWNNQLDIYIYINAIQNGGFFQGTKDGCTPVQQSWGFSFTHRYPRIIYRDFPLRGAGTLGFGIHPSPYPHQAHPRTRKMKPQGRRFHWFLILWMRSWSVTLGGKTLRSGGCIVGWLGWLVGWVGWLVGLVGLVGWLVGWLVG